MNLNKALGFPFRGEGWAGKMAIGGVLYLIPFVGWFFLAGYLVDVIRRVASDDPELVPNWDDWGAKFKQGFLGVVLFVIWEVALLIPVLVMALLFALVSDDVGSNVGSIGSVLAGIANYFFMPAYLGQYAVTGDFRAGLNVPKIMGMIKRNLGSYVGPWLLAGFFMVIAAILLWAAGALVCGIGLIFAQFYWNLFQSYLLGQLHQVLAR